MEPNIEQTQTPAEEKIIEPKKHLKLIYALIVVVVVLLAGGFLIYQNNIFNINKPRVEIPPDIIEDQTIRDDTEVIKGISAVWFGPNQDEEAQIKKEFIDQDDEYGYEVELDDTQYYTYRAMQFFEEKGMKNINTDKRYLEFVKDNGEKIVIDKYVYDLWGGIFIFDGKQNPLKVDLFSYTLDYERYFGRIIGFALIGDAFSTGDTYYIIYVKSDTENLIFEKREEKVGGETKAVLLDALELKSYDQVVSQLCLINGEPDPEILAAFDTLKNNDVEYYINPIKAWRANRKTEKFEIIDPDGITCGNEGYGI